MVIGVVIIDLYIPHALSLKDKRHYIRSVKDKLISHFKISVSEVEFQDSWQRSRIGGVVIGKDKESISPVLSSIINFSQKNWPDILLNVNTEFIDI